MSDDEINVAMADAMKTASMCGRPTALIAPAMNCGIGQPILTPCIWPRSR